MRSPLKCRSRAGNDAPPVDRLCLRRTVSPSLDGKISKIRTPRKSDAVSPNCAFCALSKHGPDTQCTGQRLFPDRNRSRSVRSDQEPTSLNFCRRPAGRSGGLRRLGLSARGTKLAGLASPKGTVPFSLRENRDSPQLAGLERRTTARVLCGSPARTAAPARRPHTPRATDFLGHWGVRRLLR